MPKRYPKGLWVIVTALLLVISSKTFGFTCLLRIDSDIGSVSSIYPSENYSYLLHADMGLFRFDGERLVQLESDIPTGPVYSVKIVDNGSHLIAADAGLFRVDGDDLVHLESDLLTDYVSEIALVENGSHLIGAGAGLFRVEGDRLILVESDLPTGYVSEIALVESGSHLIRAEAGLFHVVGNRLVRLGSDLPTGPVGAIFLVESGSHLIGAEAGFFRVEGGSLVYLEPDSPTGRVIDVVPVKNGSHLIGAEAGLFRVEDGRLVHVESDPPTGHVYEITMVNSGSHLIGAEAGLFRVEDGRLVHVESDSPTGHVYEIATVEGGWHLISAQAGLFRFDGDRLVLLESDPSTGDIINTANGKGSHLIGTDAGVFRVEGDRLVHLKSDSPTGFVMDITLIDNGFHLIGTLKGLFQVFPAESPVIVVRRTNEHVQSGQSIFFEWSLRHPCQDALPQYGLFQMRIDGREEAVPLVSAKHSADAKEFTVSSGRTLIDLAGDTTFNAVLYYRSDPNSKEWKEVAGSTTVIKVGWGVKDYIFDFARTYGGWVAIGHAGIFTALLLAARRSRKAWRIVTDPEWGRLGIYFRFLLRHSPTIQRWILTLWFDEIRSDSKAENYLPVPLSGPQGATTSSSELIAHLGPKRHIWLQGRVGMGKTQLINEIVAQYFCNRNLKSLAQAYARYGLVPIKVVLRNYADVPVPKDSPEEWLFDLAGRTLESKRLCIEDRALLKSILMSGYFVLVLDGANEVDDHGAIQQFAQRYPDIGLLVASQTDPSGGSKLFEEWMLPSDIRGATQPLLELFLGPQKGSATFDAIEESPVSYDIKSGYDVRLLADLVEAGMASDTLPSHRLGLYEAMLDSVQTKSEFDYQIADLCKVAWICWSSGRRDLIAGENISDNLLQPLFAEGVRIVRSEDGRGFVFRHDQMRGYLAAAWAALHEVSPIDLFKQSPDIWRLKRSDQQEVWEFFAEMIEPEVGVKLLEWSTLEAERAELQVALRHVANRDGW